MKKQEQKNYTLDRAKLNRRETLTNCKYNGKHMDPIGLQPMAGAVLDVGNLASLNGYAYTRIGRCQRMTKDAQQLFACVKTMKIKWWQHKRVTQ